MMARGEKIEIPGMRKANIFYQARLAAAQHLRDHISGRLLVLNAYARVAWANSLFRDYYSLFLERALALPQKRANNVSFFILAEAFGWLIHGMGPIFAIFRGERHRHDG